MLAEVNGGYPLLGQIVPIRESSTQNWHFLKLTAKGSVK
jgi:hypothetical protein